MTLPELVAVAGARWAVGDCLAEAKNETGLDHYQVRRYRSWHRHITLSRPAHAFLTVTARVEQVGRNRSRPAGTPSATRLKEVLIPVDSSCATEDIQPSAGHNG